MEKAFYDQRISLATMKIIISLKFDLLEARNTRKMKDGKVSRKHLRN